MVNNDADSQASKVLQEKIDTYIESINEAREKGEYENYTTYTRELEDVLASKMQGLLILKDFEEAKECFDLASRSYFQLYGILGDIGNNAMASMDYQTASTVFDTLNLSIQSFSETYSSVLNTLEEEGESKSLYEDIEEDLSRAAENGAVCLGFYNYSLGLQHKMNRSPDIAVGYFEKAQNSFDSIYKRTHDGIYLFFSQMSSATQITMKALEDFMRGNLTSAKTQFQQGKTALEKLKNRTIPQYITDEETKSMLENAVQVEIENTQSLYLLSDARDSFNRGAFSLARERYNQLCENAGKALEISKNLLSDAVMNMQTGDYYLYRGFRALAEGEWHREQENWDEAFDSYTKARQEWEESAEHYIASETPQAKTLQETVSNLSAPLELNIKQCEREKYLKDKIADIENDNKELMQLIQKTTGKIEINTTAEAKAETQVNIELIVEIREEVKKNTQRLLENLNDLPIDEDKKQKLNRQAEDILKSQEEDIGFLKKVKRFATDVCDVVKNVGEAAKPYLPLVASICGAAGVPIPIL